MEEHISEQEHMGPLTIVVCIKQVPLLSALRFDPGTRRLVREGLPLDINELDIYALTEAIHLRDRHGGEVIAITMGPPQAREALATALAMGADRAIHLCDRAFGGADTLATARTLALAIEHSFHKQQKQIDLILCGRHSIDAETAQVGPEIAEILDLPQISAAQAITVRQQNGKREVVAVRETDEGNETLSAPLPTLITAAEKLNEGIWPDEKSTRQASEQAGDRIQLLTAADLAIDTHVSGQAGSPTWVTEIVADNNARSGHVIAANTPEETIELLIQDLVAHKLLDEDEEGPANQDLALLTATPRRQGPPQPGKAVWVIAEHTADSIRQVTLELLGKGNDLAAALQGELVAVLMGGPGISERASVLAAYGAERIYVIEDPALANYTTDGYAYALTEMIQRYQPTVVLIGSTANGRDLAPRVAARLKIGLTGDCIDLTIDEQQRLVQHKPAFGGSIVSYILSNTKPAMATLRPGMLHAAQPDFERETIIERIQIAEIAPRIRTHIISHEHRDTGVTALETAHTVIGVGVGMGNPQPDGPLYQLAALLHAAIGATRNVTDKGWLPRHRQIGLTGRAISPRLYLALGIRGASEHIAGIRKAGYIVAINKNKRAAIFRHADAGVAGDVHVLVPLLVEKLQQRIHS